MYHETWHYYLPGIPNLVFFRLFGCMLAADPQVFDLVHWDHHQSVRGHDSVAPGGRRTDATGGLATGQVIAHWGESEGLSA